MKTFKEIKETIKAKLAAFRERWEADETKVGKIFKYYIGYVGIGSAFITNHVTDITALFMNAGVVMPIWLPKVFLACGIIGYIIGKSTKKKADEQV